MMKSPVQLQLSGTAVLMAVGLGVGVFVVWKGVKALGSVVDYVGEKVTAVKEAVVETAKTAVDPLSANKPIITDPSGTQTAEETQWQNDQLNVWAMGNMGA
jgi:hypothetical protein